MSRRWWPWFRCSHCGLRRKWRHDRTVEHPPPPYLLRQLTGAPIIDFDVDTITVRLVDTELGRCDTCGGSGLEGYEGSGFGECPDCINGFRPFAVTSPQGEPVKLRVEGFQGHDEDPDMGSVLRRRLVSEWEPADE